MSQRSPSVKKKPHRSRPKPKPLTGKRLERAADHVAMAGRIMLVMSTAAELRDLVYWKRLKPSERRDAYRYAMEFVGEFMKHARRRIREGRRNSKGGAA